MVSWARAVNAVSRKAKAAKRIREDLRRAERRELRVAPHDGTSLSRLPRFVVRWNRWVRANDAPRRNPCRPEPWVKTLWPKRPLHLD